MKITINDVVFTVPDDKNIKIEDESNNFINLSGGEIVGVLFGKIRFVKLKRTNFFQKCSNEKN